MRRIILRYALAGAGLTAATPAIPETAPALPALLALERGRWQIRDLETGTADTMCITDRRVLMQLRHGAAQCAWTVTRNETRDATVTYNCGDGSGRTTLRVETPRLAQIDSQGVLDGTPYALRAEARRVGTCR